MLGWRAEAGRDEERTELIAVNTDGMGLIIQARPPEVHGGRVVEELLLNRIPVEPATVHSRRVIVARAPGHVLAQVQLVACRVRPL